MENRPKVGVGVIIIKDSKILLGKRKNAHGEGDWSFPGGHLELGESWEICAIREVLEETGLNIKDLKFLTATNDIFDQNKHYITILITANYQSGQVQLREPEKCESWNWFDWDKLPTPLFLPIKNFLKTNINPLI